MYKASGILKRVVIFALPYTTTMTHVEIKGSSGGQFLPKVDVCVIQGGSEHYYNKLYD